MRVTRKQFTIAVASLLAGVSVGCVTTSDGMLVRKPVSEKQPSLLERMPFVGKKKDNIPEPYPNPVKIAATWTPDTLVQVGRTPTRGFGGRVFFYDEKSRPVPVEGTLMVHGFDDSSSSPEDSAKRFVFTPEQFTRHFGQSDLGASYSVWIPWDAVGGEQRKISLVTSFQTAKGETIQGIPATLLLPGKETDFESTDDVAKFSKQYQDYLAATHSVTNSGTGLTTTTIRRRRPDPMGREFGSPAITIPSRSINGQMIAGESGTRSFDLQMQPRPTGPSRATVMPASAIMPTER